MKETTAIEKINNIIESIDYKSAYIEIQTKSDKYILEKEKKNRIGFN